MIETVLVRGSYLIWFRTSSCRLSTAGALVEFSLRPQSTSVAFAQRVAPSPGRGLYPPRSSLRCGRCKTPNYLSTYFMLKPMSLSRTTNANGPRFSC
jgi:hypothetical protein